MPHWNWSMLGTDWPVPVPDSGSLLEDDSWWEVWLPVPCSCRQLGAGPSPAEAPERSAMMRRIAWRSCASMAALMLPLYGRGSLSPLSLPLFVFALMLGSGAASPTAGRDSVIVCTAWVWRMYEEKHGINVVVGTVGAKTHPMPMHLSPTNTPMCFLFTRPYSRSKTWTRNKKMTLGHPWHPLSNNLMMVATLRHHARNLSSQMFETNRARLSVALLVHCAQGAIKHPQHWPATPFGAGTWAYTSGGLDTTHA